MKRVFRSPSFESVVTALICTLLIMTLRDLSVFNFLMFFTSIPLIVLAVKYSKLNGMFSLCMLCIPLTFKDTYLSVALMTLYAPMILLIPYIIYSDMSLLEGVLICAGTAFLSFVVLLMIFSLMVGEDIFTYTWSAIRTFFMTDSEIVKKSLKLYKKIGVLDGGITAIQFGELVIDQLKLLSPALIAIIAIIYGGLNFLLTIKVLEVIRHDGYIPSIPRFKTWKLPSGVIAGFFVIMLLSSLGAAAGLKNFDLTNTTIYILFTFIFSIQGLAVAKYFLEHREIPRIIQYLILGFSFLLLKTPLALVGLCDQAFNMRALEEEEIFE